VSLATDSASEAIYSLLPFFLTQVLGAGAVSLGIIEGAAEATNSALKMSQGGWRTGADETAAGARRLRSRRSSGHSSRSRSRGARLRRAVRGPHRQRHSRAPRDAMLATWTTPSTRGKVYGFHRGMDHTGAIIGPALATLFLYFYPGEYRTLFALTIIPGAIAVALIFFVPEEASPDSPVVSGFNRTDFPVASGLSRTSTEPLPRSFYSFMSVLTLFSLGNSTDAFLLLRLTDAAGSVKFVPLMWSALHVVKAATSLVGGSWSDRIGRRAVITIGWLIYAVVYAGFAMSSTLPALLAWFLVYGFYFGFAEGTREGARRRPRAAVAPWIRLRRLQRCRRHRRPRRERAVRRDLEEAGPAAAFDRRRARHRFNRAAVRRRAREVSPR
jgi:MFS family permease